MDNLKERVLVNGFTESLNDKKINNPPHVGLALKNILRVLLSYILSMAGSIQYLHDLSWVFRMASIEALGFPFLSSER